MRRIIVFEIEKKINLHKKCPLIINKLRRLYEFV